MQFLSVAAISGISGYYCNIAFYIHLLHTTYFIVLLKWGTIQSTNPASYKNNTCKPVSWQGHFSQNDWEKGPVLLLTFLQDTSPAKSINTVCINKLKNSIKIVQQYKSILYVCNYVDILSILSLNFNDLNILSSDNIPKDFQARDEIIMIY